MAAAIELARRGNNPQVEPEHLLAALSEQADGIVPELLRKMTVEPATVVRGARELLKQLFRSGVWRLRKNRARSPRLKLVTEQAQAEADRMKDDFVSTEHLFIALADERRPLPLARNCSSSTK